MAKFFRTLIVLVVVVIVVRIALPFAGSWLIAADPLQHADAVVILASNRMDRAYEGGALYREKYVPLVLLSHPDETSFTATAKGLGVTIPTAYDLQRSALLQMGVPQSSLRDLPGQPISTEDEAALIRRTADALNLRSVIVATSAYHTRRARFYVRLAARGRYHVAVRPSRFERVFPQTWWRHPGDRTDVILEWLKLPKLLWSSITA
ncbi:MAG TPA: YdcF family protein [Thermoanaerobaculia bacterium]|nr:YdcF family protein [Thermoanaerobaculia bacterium]